jgi:protein-L-isoaspartate(D-aspartate) O-methyltransferase
MKYFNNKFYTLKPLAFLLFLACNGCAQNNAYQKQLENMVKEQIQARGITDKRVLRALLKVPRHLFVPGELINKAYGDHPLAIGYGQTISQPYIVAFMTEIVVKENTRKVLEIGTGSGYQAAILGELCDSVFTIEIIPELAINAKILLDSLKYRNIIVKHGDGYLGWVEHSPFDAIIVTCAPTHIPPALIAQLAENGRMIIPVGEHYNQNLILLRKKNGKIIQENVLPVLFVPMIDSKYRKY